MPQASVEESIELQNATMVSSMLTAIQDFVRDSFRTDSKAALDTVEVGEWRFRFLSTPGHTPGQGCYYDDKYVFSGDTLFAGSIGRTDFPLSDPELMWRSLRRLMALPGHLLVCSGHGPVTTLEEELRGNPFLDYLRRERGMPSFGSGVAPGPRWG
jgi:glyoxylase-like metal-dependent hydrolase (beta-lactamase superfamily II)